MVMAFLLWSDARGIGIGGGDMDPLVRRDCEPAHTGIKKIWVGSGSQKRTLKSSALTKEKPREPGVSFFRLERSLIRTCSSS